MMQPLWISKDPCITEEKGKLIKCEGGGVGVCEPGFWRFEDCKCSERWLCPLHQSITIDSQELMYGKWDLHVACTMWSLANYDSPFIPVSFLGVGGRIGVLFARIFLRYDFPKVRFSYLRIKSYSLVIIKIYNSIRRHTLLLSPSMNLKISGENGTLR